MASRILYEDNHVLVFNKRAGEITQGDRTGDEPLPEKLKAFIAARDHKPGRVFMGVPHRLDRPVSGAPSGPARKWSSHHGQDIQGFGETIRSLQGW